MFESTLSKIKLSLFVIINIFLFGWILVAQSWSVVFWGPFPRNFVILMILLLVYLIGWTVIYFYEIPAAGHEASSASAGKKEETKGVEK